MGNEFVRVPRVLLDSIVLSARRADVTRQLDLNELQRLIDKTSEQHQGALVALPERRDINQADDFKRGIAHGFNACLVEIARLGPLYIHADLGEVEQFPHGSPANKAVFMALESYTGTTTFEQACLQLAEESRALRAQLTERDALLRELCADHAVFVACPMPLARRIDAALSASAEPSAPKCKTCNGTGMVDDGEITCSEGGIPYENGPVKCVKDCPDCAPIEHDERAAFEAAYAAEFSEVRGTPYTAADVASMRNGDLYGDRPFLNGQWAGWQARAALERKPAPAPFTHQVGTLKLGIKGAAYDQAGTYRAYTYEEQPHNVEASKLGRAASSAKPGGDWIDYGLSLLKALQDQGFGVFDLNAIERKP